MTYPASFHRLQVYGTGAGEEVWSLGLSIRAGIDAPTANATDTAVTSVPDALMTATQSFIANQCGKPLTLVGIKLNQVDTLGHYTQETTNNRLYAGAGVVPSSTTGFPPQVACAVSLESGLRGPRRRGRFYLPYPNMAINPLNGQFTDTSIGNVATAAQTWIRAINDIPGYHVVIASSAGTGGFALVTGVRVGSRPDTIRSRGNALPEVYTLASI